jgi:peptide/nickel transport system substrate-binding protein
LLHHTWRKVIVLTALSLVSLACVSPSSAPQAQQSSAAAADVQPKRVVAAIGGDLPVVFRNVLASPAGVPGSDAVDELVNGGLAIRDNTARYRPELAIEVPSVDNGLWKVLPDGRMEMTWTIRPGAHWHDGMPFTAHDAVFTTQVARDRALPNLRVRELDALDRVEALDDRTIVARWDRPFLNADRLFTNELAPLVARHRLEQAYAENKDSLLLHPYWSDEFVGTGPYRVRELARGNHVILDAFDGYVLGRPKVDVLEIRFVPEDNSLMAGILAGDFELTLGDGLSLEQSVNLSGRWPEGRMVTELSSMQVLYPNFNPAYASPSALLDMRFRQALLFAMDRQQIVDVVMHGLTTPSVTVLTGIEGPQFREMEAGVMHYEYDPRRAAQMIEELGFNKGTDGYYHDPIGQPLSPVEVRTTAADESEKIMYTTVDGWERLGVHAQPNIVPRARNQDREYRHTRPGFIIVGGQHGLDSIAPFQTSQIPTAATNWVGGNNAQYSSPELEALYDQYFITMSERTRIPLVNQILRHYSVNLPYFPVFKRVEATMVSNRLLNVHASGSWATQAWNAHEWEVG